jgi:ribosomal protein L13E
MSIDILSDLCNDSEWFPVPLLQKILVPTTHLHPTGTSVPPKAAGEGFSTHASQKWGLHGARACAPQLYLFGHTDLASQAGVQVDRRDQKSKKSNSGATHEWLFTQENEHDEAGDQ